MIFCHSVFHKQLCLKLFFLLLNDRQSITKALWPHQNSQHTSVYGESCLVVFFHSVFLFCRSSLPNCVRFPLRLTILLHARSSLHHAVSLHCACAVPVWSELPNLNLLPVASSRPRWGAPADGSQELGNRVHLPDQAGQIQETERNARENVREVEASA